MSDSAEVVLAFSVLTCQANQFMSDPSEILNFTQSSDLRRIIQLSDAFRQVCSAEQGQIFSSGVKKTVKALTKISKSNLKSWMKTFLKQFESSKNNNRPAKTARKSIKS